MSRPALALAALGLLAATPATDANKDGDTSLGEYVAAFERIAAASDADADGYLTLEEMQTFAELTRELQVVDEFDLFDSNENGVLELAEYQQARKSTDPMLVLQSAVSNGLLNADDENSQAKMMAWMEETQRVNERARERTTAFLSLPADYNPYDFGSRDPDRADQASVEYLRFEHVVRFMTLDRNEDRVIDREESLRTDPFAEN